MKRSTNRKRKKRPTFREIYNASPMIQRNLASAAICFGFVALAFLILLVAGGIRYVCNL